MKTVSLLLGSDLDDRELNLSITRHFIGFKVGKIRESSSIYETEAWGFDGNGKFLNQVIRVLTDMEPLVLLNTLKDIEVEIGRIRYGEGYESRVIDVDILFYEDRVLVESELIIPHPKIQDRLFTLIPLMELDDEYIHPGLNKSIRQLAAECDDTLTVELFAT